LHLLCLRNGFALIQKQEWGMPASCVVIVCFFISLPPFSSLYHKNKITATCIKIAVIFFLWYNEEKGGRDMKKQTITTQDAGMPRSCF
jgi:hypothetical protein